MENLISNLGTSTPDNLVAGHEIPVIVKGITLAKNQSVLLRGTVVGKVTATGLCVPVDNSKVDGSQTALCILTDTVDTTSATDIKATGYFSGCFNSKALVFGGDDTAADHELRLRELGIFLKENIA